jgi:hypothetical protein
LLSGIKRRDGTDLAHHLHLWSRDRASNGHLYCAIVQNLPIDTDRAEGGDLLIELQLFARVSNSP